jgi:hypothetical protein
MHGMKDKTRIIVLSNLGNQEQSEKKKKKKKKKKTLQTFVSYKLKFFLSTCGIHRTYIYIFGRSTYVQDNGSEFCRALEKIIRKRKIYLYI